MLRAAPLLLLVVLLLPLGGGLAATLLPAFGLLPALGGTRLSLAPWRALLAWPGLGTSLRLTLVTGLATPLLAFATAAGLAVLARRPLVARLLRPALAPLLATPHAAMAIGLAFLFAPSGWLARLLAPLLGWSRPPDIAFPGDPWGLALIAGLWLKETPYLLLMILAALARVDPAATLRQAAAMGYGPWRAWIFAVLPRLWPQLRLPVMASTAFALSVVDVALILGPSDPPTLAVLVLRRFTDPDLQQWFSASAGAVLLAAIVLSALALLHGLAGLLGGLGRHVLRRGHRGGGAAVPDAIAAAGAAVLAGAGAAALAVLAVWSFATAWRFPAARCPLAGASPPGAPRPRPCSAPPASPSASPSPRPSSRWHSASARWNMNAAAAAPDG